jgi:hypothetical protein
MACTSCQTSFQNAQPVVISIVKSGANALVFVQNQGRSIVHLRRIILCSGGSTFFLRPPPAAISWSGPEYLEPGATSQYFSTTPAAGASVEAQVEYVEISGRSRSCIEQF